MPPATAATTVLDNWAGKSLDEVLGDLRDLLEDPEYPTVKRWREAGGKVLGHFQVYFPEEIAHAAGMLPLKMRGAQVEARQAEARFGSYLCSIIKTSLELALSGRVELDLFVTHPICDAARNLAAVWGRNFSYPCEILYLPQNANSAHAVEYLRDEYDRVRRTHRGRGRRDGHRRRPAPLDRRVQREPRACCARCTTSSAQRPWLLPVDEAYVLMAVGGCIPREEHNALLRAVLPQIEARRGPARRTGCASSSRAGSASSRRSTCSRTIGQSCYVVDDDLLIGLRWITEDVRDSPAIRFTNLAEAYLERSTVQPGAARPAQAQGADAARAHSRTRAPAPRSSRRPRCASRASTSRWPTRKALDEAQHSVLRQRVRGEHDELRASRRFSSRRSSRTCCSRDGGRRIP